MKQNHTSSQKFLFQTCIHIPISNIQWSRLCIKWTPRKISKFLKLLPTGLSFLFSQRSLPRENSTCLFDSSKSVILGRNENLCHPSSCYLSPQVCMHPDITKSRSMKWKRYGRGRWDWAGQGGGYCAFCLKQKYARILKGKSISCI